MNNLLVCTLFLFGVSLGVLIDRTQCASCKTSTTTTTTTTRGPGRQPPIRYTCANVLCLRGSQCRLINGRAQCVCNEACPAIYDPVCGTDAKDYSNSCTLEVTACKQQSGVEVAHKGKCTSENKLTCASVKCIRGSQCRMVDNRPQCICNSICPQIFDPVCGTDGKDYSNSCTLEVAACKQQSGVQVAHKGKCTSDKDEQPRASREEPQEQEPESEPERDPCAIVRCGWGAQCRVVEGRAKCECPVERCPNNIQGVCGSDGKTYATDCDLRAEACERKESVQVAHQGACIESGDTDTDMSGDDN